MRNSTTVFSFTLLIIIAVNKTVNVFLRMCRFSTNTGKQSLKELQTRSTWCLVVLSSLMSCCASAPPADMEVKEAEQRRQVEEQVEQLLAGQGLEVSGCDVALDQSKPATLRRNVTYIVCAVVFNDKVRLPASVHVRACVCGPSVC